MPTYDYRCDACQYVFEKFQSITAEPVRKCPQCGKKKVKRLLGTGAGIIFKGSGFYQTDYRSESYKTAAKAESGTSSSSGDAKSSGESKPSTDTPAAKPAAKETSKPAAKSEKSSAKK
jgi:putative FmdB family regulatory protein